MPYINKSEFENVEITAQENDYIIRNHDTYFKLGINEGKLLEALSSGKEKEDIVAEFGIAPEELEQFVDALHSNAVIGEAPKDKEKQSIFFLKLPLFEANALMSSAARFIKSHRVFFYLLCGIFGAFTLFGFTLFGLHGREIFSLRTIKLPVWEYVLLYVLLLIDVALHEFSHGLVCSLLGCRVGKIGAMLIFFSPALYCDISGIRTEPKRSKQVLTSAAGLIFNAFVVSLSSVLFHLTHAYFWANFCLINLMIIYSNIMPFIKLDGYWMLSFATGATNLYSKSLSSIPLLFRKSDGKTKLMSAYGLATVVFAVVNIAALVIGIVDVIRSLVLSL